MPDPRHSVSASTPTQGTIGSPSMSHHRSARPSPREEHTSVLSSGGAGGGGAGGHHSLPPPAASGYYAPHHGHSQPHPGYSHPSHPSGPGSLPPPPPASNGRQANGHQMYANGHSREYERSPYPPGGGARDREVSISYPSREMDLRERDRDREREMDRVYAMDRERDRDLKERDRRERDRERERERVMFEREKEKERQRERDRHHEREMEREVGQRERERAMERELRERERAHGHPELGQPGGPTIIPAGAGPTQTQVLNPIQAAIVRGTEGPLTALAQANEQTWLLIGAVSEQLSDTDRALAAYENALRHNPMSVSALTQVGGIARGKEDFGKAIDFYQRVLNISQENGEVWGSLGHCYLMMDDLQKAYTAYQQALYRLPNPKDPKLWYGIGILYDRYGSLEHAEEAFSSVLRMEPNFEKANEIYFRLGIIYKQQHKYSSSLECFRYILGHPPRPLTEIDIWFQIGHVHEQQKDYTAAKDAYERVLSDNPNHAKVLQQLGWLYHQTSASFTNQDLAIQYLTKSLEADAADAQSWYLLGRAFMGGQKYNKAYEAYQQAVYRDGRNPTFWCSIGVLYYQINQYRDALDAYSRAIRLNPYISEVWYDLGSLYESCNNQVNDAIDAYARAQDLDPTNTAIKNRLHLLKNAQRDGMTLPPPPPPQDVHPTAYAQPANRMAFPGQQTGGAGGAPGPAPGFEGPAQAGHAAAPGEQLPVVNGRDLAAPPTATDVNAANPFRSGIPPPLANVDESRGSMARHAPLAPMEIERNGAVLANAPASHGGSVPRPESAASMRSRYDGPARPKESPRSGYPSPYIAEAPRAFEGPSRTAEDALARSREHERYRSERRDERETSRDPRAPSASYHRMSPPLAGRRSPVSRAGRPYDPRAEASPVLARRTAAVESTADRHIPSGRKSPAVKSNGSSKPDEDRRREPLGLADRTQEEEERRRPVASPASAITSPKRNGTPDSRKRRRKGKIAGADEKDPVVMEKKKPDEDVEMASTNGDARSQSSKRSPPPAKPVETVAPPAPSSRVIDEDYDEGAADALMGLAGYRGPERTSPVARLDPHQITSKIASVPPADAAKIPVTSLKRHVSPSSPSENDPRPTLKRQKTDGQGSSRATSPVTQQPTKATTTIIEVLNSPSATRALTPREPSTKDNSPASSKDGPAATTPDSLPKSTPHGEVDELEEEPPVENAPATVLDSAVAESDKPVENTKATEVVEESTQDEAGTGTSTPDKSGTASESKDTVPSEEKSFGGEEKSVEEAIAAS